MGQCCGCRCCAPYWSWLCCEEAGPNRITLRSGEYATLMGESFDAFSLDEDMPMETNEKRKDGRDRGTRAQSAVVVQPVAASRHK
ncbi:myristylated tegument protein [Psittacid alphaherpesvirus 1]|nr:myristylated tegument protein [Psittacid alphaherpesvirus 1]